MCVCVCVRYAAYALRSMSYNMYIFSSCLSDLPIWNNNVTALIMWIVWARGSGLFAWQMVLSIDFNSKSEASRLDVIRNDYWNIWSYMRCDYAQSLTNRKLLNCHSHDVCWQNEIRFHPFRCGTESELMIRVSLMSDFEHLLCQQTRNINTCILIHSTRCLCHFCDIKWRKTRARIANVVS